VSKMISGHEFAKTLGIDANYVYAAIEMYPPEHTQRPDRAHVWHPAEEIARSVRLYSKWKARKLQQDYKKKLDKVAGISRRAGEAMAWLEGKGAEA